MFTSSSLPPRMPPLHAFRSAIPQSAHRVPLCSCPSFPYRQLKMATAVWDRTTIGSSIPPMSRMPWHLPHSDFVEHHSRYSPTPPSPADLPSVVFRKPPSLLCIQHTRSHPPVHRHCTHGASQDAHEFLTVLLDQLQEECAVMVRGWNASSDVSSLVLIAIGYIVGHRRHRRHPAITIGTVSLRYCSCCYCCCRNRGFWLTDVSAGGRWHTNTAPGRPSQSHIRLRNRASTHLCSMWGR